jgi:hypothetical protein
MQIYVMTSSVYQEVSAVLTARLKPCPFKTDLCNDFQRLSGGFGGFDGTAKAVPFQSRFMK